MPAFLSSVLSIAALGILQGLSMAQTKQELTSDEKRLLDHFWNRTSKDTRAFMPANVVAFLESERRCVDHTSAFEITIQGELAQLVSKGYLSSAGGGIFGPFRFSLTNEGTKFVLNKHPRLIVLLETILERTPVVVTGLVALIGFVSSVLGIAQFVGWWSEIPPG